MGDIIINESMACTGSMVGASAMKATTKYGRLEALGGRLQAERGRLKMKPKELADAAEIPIDSYRKYEGGAAVPGGVALAGLAKAGVRVEWLLTGAEPMKDEPPRAEQPAAGYTIEVSAARRFIVSVSEELRFDPGGAWTALLIELMTTDSLKPSGARKVLEHLAAFQAAARDAAA